jgi:hypothetical protein
MCLSGEKTLSIYSLQVEKLKEYICIYIPVVVHKGIKAQSRNWTRAKATPELFKKKSYFPLLRFTFHHHF